MPKNVNAALVCSDVWENIVKSSWDIFLYDVHFNSSKFFLLLVLLGNNTKNASFIY